ncbi:MAG: glycosyltransferase involved in cell wall biosynthesis [Planctomycetota bacterium]|jgi:glycosyltransferase involved in cell wall biosynthesis
MPASLAIVLKGYPRLSETFIAQEIKALEDRGFELCIFSLRHPYDPATHPIHAEIKADIHYLPEYIRDDIPRVIKCWWRIRKSAGFGLALRCFVRDWRRDFSINRLRRFAQAMVMAVEMPTSVGLYYTHFMHTPSSVSYYAAQMTGKPWSISAHAKDIWTIGEWELREKLANAAWLVTCTRANADYLKTLTDKSDKVTLLYHGLDFNRFDVQPGALSSANGDNADARVKLISVGRAVDKKGYQFLLTALAGLDPKLHWEFLHIGGGELLEELKQQARELKLEDRIQWLGALPQTEVLAMYREADIFVLPSRISDDGDRDGLPNVLMEAQSQQLVCLSTDISGIPELIENEVTGLLVEQKNSDQLVTALTRLISDPQLRHALGQAGYERVRQRFSMDRGIDGLVQKIRLVCGDKA